MLVAVRECLCSSLVSFPSDLEIVSVKLGNDLVICCIYIPPDSPLSYVSSLVHFLSDLASSFSKCTFVGEFNFPHVDWFSLTSPSYASACFVTLYLTVI